jgi:hypothetical protein
MRSQERVRFLDGAGTGGDGKHWKCSKAGDGLLFGQTFWTPKASIIAFTSSPSG